MGPAAGTKKGGSRSVRREGRIGRRPRKPTAATALREQENGFNKLQDGSRCCPHVQSPPCHHVAASGRRLFQIVKRLNCACRARRRSVRPAPALKNACVNYLNPAAFQLPPTGTVGRRQGKQLMRSGCVTG